MNGTFLLLGTNLGDREANLNQAIQLLITRHAIKLVRQSSIYESEPWGKSDQPWFLNMVLEIDSGYAPEQLLDLCLRTEEQMGRERKEKWGERLIDIDILYFKNLEMTQDQLKIPHPEIPNRRFTLVPLCELAPMDTHPAMNVTQKELLDNCVDPLACKLYRP